MYVLIDIKLYMWVIYKGISAQKSACSSYKMLMIHRFNLKSIMRNVQQYFEGVFYRFMALFCDNNFLLFRREVHYTHILPKGTLSVQLN